MFTVKLEQNREDRPRYVNLVTYEQRWVPIGDLEALRLIPVRRTYQWVVGEVPAFQCTRVTELRWRDLKAQPAHREFMEQWVQHVKAQLAKVKRGGKRVRVQVVEDVPDDVEVAQREADLKEEAELRRFELGKEGS